MLKDKKISHAVPWSPESWKNKPAKQMPDYHDPAGLQAVTGMLAQCPPLVSTGGMRRLEHSLAAASAGDAFLLQAGDCAESFAEFHPENIRSTLNVMSRMGAEITSATDIPVIRVGRIAGQFAKPRSQAFETRDGVTLPSYQGDMINGVDFAPESRRADPQRMIRAYHQSADTMKYVRSAGFFTSHEALLLPYEQALTRFDEELGGWHDFSAHFLWVGDRTRQADGAHVEFLRGIKNPIGIKCGTDLSAGELLELLDILNPDNAAGRITLISRMGHQKVNEILPELVRAVKREGRAVTWVCDPMHGNTKTLQTGYKTREFGNILSEVNGFFAVHGAEGTFPGGVHLELAGRDVTECTGGSIGITEDQLPERYHTHCDPRLNASQGLELSCLIADELRAFSKRRRIAAEG